MNAPFRRKEDNRLVRGLGRFVDDEGGRALHLRLVRSPYAHARALCRWTIARRSPAKALFAR